MNTLLLIVISIVIFDFVLDSILDHLGHKSYSPTLPKEAEGIYDAEKYNESYRYHKDYYAFGWIQGGLKFIISLCILYFGWYNYLDLFVREKSDNMIFMTWIFVGIIAIATDIIFIPFGIYSTFVIEKKYGFNKTTAKTYILDKLKGYLLAAIIGAPISALIIYIYQNTGNYFWLLAWGVISVFTIFMAIFYTSLIVPLFNKLSPLPEGELRDAIQAYCNKVGFKLNNIFVMDGSKRSNHSNAYFSGIGSRKKIVLYDTLIEKHTKEEIVATIAHEVGHYKKGHIMSGLVWQVIYTGIVYYILSLFLNNPEMSKAINVEQASFYANVFAFSILYSPISQILSVISNITSRKHEFEADAYAKETYGGKALADALKKLSVDNLSNPKPHPVCVFMNYSHPPLLKRLEKLNS